MAETIASRIRAEIEGPILSGEWPPGTRIPFEHELTARFGCSRMTVNKVLSALAAEGLITRRRRTGSVVASPPGERALLEIHDLALEARRAGRQYRHEVLERVIRRAKPPEAQALGLSAGARLLCLTTLHHTDGVPDAYETRLICLDTVPEAEAESFRDMPPGTWLLARVAWTEAEHAVAAIPADAALAQRLQVERGAACLLLERRTWQSGRLVTEARIAYPGNRHRLVGRFGPGGR
ncbi:histidine utilization repressor [Sabulicella rubraurantiaca]|uniref:histidine utilization repressor n=1 Tax=Sabulicella rubraurantiaca TaxID=2811429 RepID=UPI001A95729B|nr:histidine utilization repressor [Sabulicella rubraurantiaca]